MNINNKNKIKMVWKWLLYQSCDGSSLRESSKCAQAHCWTTNGSTLLSSKDFISAIHTRYGILYSKSRAQRGRFSGVSQCSCDCLYPETLNHMVQQCFATHLPRISRHNKIVDYVQKINLDRGRIVHIEPIFELSDHCKLKTRYGDL